MSLPPTSGNTFLPPPRLTGDPAVDILSLQRYLQANYDQLNKVANVVGQLANHEARITALEKKEALEP